MEGKSKNVSSLLDRIDDLSAWWKWEAIRFSWLFHQVKQIEVATLAYSLPKQSGLI